MQTACCRLKAVWEATKKQSPKKEESNAVQSAFTALSSLGKYWPEEVKIQKLLQKMYYVLVQGKQIPLDGTVANRTENKIMKIMHVTIKARESNPVFPLTLWWTFISCDPYSFKLG